MIADPKDVFKIQILNSTDSQTRLLSIAKISLKKSVSLICNTAINLKINLFFLCSFIACFVPWSKTFLSYKCYATGIFQWILKEREKVG